MKRFDNVKYLKRFENAPVIMTINKLAAMLMKQPIAERDCSIVDSLLSIWMRLLLLSFIVVPETPLICRRVIAACSCELLIQAAEIVILLLGVKMIKYTYKQVSHTGFVNSLRLLLC
jgi:hypothetical protein